MSYKKGPVTTPMKPSLCKVCLVMNIPDKNDNNVRYAVMYKVRSIGFQHGPWQHIL